MRFLFILLGLLPSGVNAQYDGPAVEACRKSNDAWREYRDAECVRRRALDMR